MRFRIACVIVVSSIERGVMPIENKNYTTAEIRSGSALLMGNNKLPGYRIVLISNT
jgi:hypothetical protein